VSRGRQGNSRICVDDRGGGDGDGGGAGLLSVPQVCSSLGTGIPPQTVREEREGVRINALGLSATRKP
jgi:hypothetical protein